MSGQHCRHFMLPPSTRFVSITMEGHFSCQINLQKSMTVFGRGAGEWEEDDTMRIHIHKCSTTELHAVHAHYMLSKTHKSYIYMYISSLPCHSTVYWFGMIITSKCCTRLFTAAPVFMYLYSCPDRWHHCLPCVAMNLRRRE